MPLLPAQNPPAASAALVDPSATALTPDQRAAVWVVIAAFQEARAIGGVVRRLRAAGWPSVVVVDDGSADATATEAVAAGAVVLRHLVNRGQGAALQTGIAYALRQGARAVVTFDADGQHSPDDLPALVAPVLGGQLHAALGSRFLQHAADVPWQRRLLLRLAVLFAWLTSGVRLSDAHNGLRCLSAQLASRIDLQLDRMAHASEIVDQIARSGLPFAEVSVRVVYTDYSQAKGQRAGAAVGIALDYLLGRWLGRRQP